MSSPPLNGKPTPLLWEELAALSPHQRKLKLLAKMASSEDALKRFWKKVQKGRPDECWNWLASTNTDGYGQFAFYPEPGGKKSNLQAHQIAYFLANGNIPDELCVCHTCDNPRCNNHHHLFAGTQADNTRDRDQKGRHISFKGSENATAVLTEGQVQEIRILWFGKHIHVNDIAALFDVSVSCIKGIVYGANWKQLPLPPEILDHY